MSWEEEALDQFDRRHPDWKSNLAERQRKARAEWTETHRKPNSCPYMYCKQLWNAGKQDDYSEPYCRQDEHPCDLENGECRISKEEEISGD